MKRSMLESYAGSTVLALGAHPDDVEMGMGGTVARLAQVGARVIVAVVCAPSQLEIRRREAQAACDVLGATFHLICERASSRVEDMRGHELVARVDELVKEYRPAAVFSHGAVDYHRDHRLVFEAFRATLRLGAMDAYCYQPCSCRPGAMKFEPQVFVDIGATLDLKMAAVGAHRSQFLARGLGTDFLRDVARFYGFQAGVGYAEGLEVIRLALG